MDKLNNIKDFENAINKVSKLLEKNKNIIDIVYSLTFHESPESMLDQLLNIITFNHLNKILIICSINDSMNAQVKNVRLPPNIIIHPFIRLSSMGMLWNTNLFEAHMNNLEYVKNKNLKFDYFCTLASNEMFIKNINISEIKNKIVLKPKKFVLTEPVKILNKLNSWVHYKTFMENFNLCSFFLVNGYEPFAQQHEGTILPSDVMYDILNLYRKDNFSNKVINTQNVLLEEVFIPTYLNNHYEYNGFVLTYRNFEYYSVSKEEIEKANLYSVKRVPRELDHEIRCFIRNIYLSYLISGLNISI
jgi:hypothetical protein